MHKEKKAGWWLYIVECADGSLYTGITTNIKRRLLEHNYSEKAAKYTRSRRPVKLVHSEKCIDRSDASKKEYKIKKKTKKQKIQFILENKVSKANDD